MSLDKLLDGAQVIAIVCNQWGDTGKGKFSDYFAAEWADVIARGTGGNNAGHTVIVKGKEKIFHLLPTGILYDKDGKTTVLGNGMVIDPRALCAELEELEHEGLSYQHLMVSKDAHVIMPYHVQRDKAKDVSQKDGGIGSTGRGIGPCYADKIARRGVSMGDLFDKDVLVRKLHKVREFYPEFSLSDDDLISFLEPHVKKIAPFVRDTVSEMHHFYREGKRILLEGAQGLLLSIEHGTYPYVTSSDCSLNGTANGVGLSAKAVDLPLGIVKYPFMTRVGAGPFPTELAGKRSEVYCAESKEDGSPQHGKLEELREYHVPHSIEGSLHFDRKDPRILQLMNSQDPFVQGIGIRLAAGEYGATTTRPRRVGWTDAVAARYAVGINGPLMILTKVDAVSGLEEFRVCHGYSGSDDFPRDEKLLRQAQPVYKVYTGYKDVKAGEYDQLPESLKQSIEEFERFTQGRVVAVSVGAEKDETIVR